MSKGNEEIWVYNSEGHGRLVPIGEVVRAILNHLEAGIDKQDEYAIVKWSKAWGRKKGE